MKILSFFPTKFFFISTLFIILFINIMYLYLNTSCSTLSPQQQCICYELKMKTDSKYFENYKKTCEKFRSIDD